MKNFFGELMECVGWVTMIGVFFYLLVYCTPPQKSAEADAFDAACIEEGV